jgi:hypothetical protein
MDTAADTGKLQEKANEAIQLMFPWQAPASPSGWTADEMAGILKWFRREEQGKTE